MTKVDASPTKTFFVEMLKRDIALEDAILDLIDNCVDGILRTISTAKRNSDSAYNGFYAEITATPKEFKITDNCGGIPKNVAEKSAFRMGREKVGSTDRLPTVGAYGIGMKRAIFKMGIEASVESKPKNEKAYQVDFTKAWMNSKNWDLVLKATRQTLDSDGTSITVSSLHPEIKTAFTANASPFLLMLRKQIAITYALIIMKGFKIILNGVEIIPEDVALLFADDAKKVVSKEKKISPYIYKSDHNDVSVELYVGFYRPLALDEEMESENQAPRSRDQAGWTIICNDRVVVLNDKTSLTGWGLPGVPRYHNQFIAIAGVVVFKSNYADRLPLNSTKRGLNMSSSVYVDTLEYMTAGLKKFTDFTNKWKGREEETAKYFKATKAINVADMSKVSSKLKNWASAKKAAGKIVQPDLPVPANADKKVLVSFYKERYELDLLINKFFDPEDAVKASQVGVLCWDLQIEAINKRR